MWKDRGQVDDHHVGAADDSPDPPSSRRQLVEIRCGFAELAHREAQAAEARVAETRVRFDEQMAVLVAAQAEVDPRAARVAKEVAHSGFRRAIAGASTRSQVELAAAAWLAEINRINAAARAAQSRVGRERDATDALAVEIDRLTPIAETSRAMAESAAEACRAAQEALAADQGELAAGAAGDPSSGSAAELLSAHEAAQSAKVEEAPAPPAPTLESLAIRHTAPPAKLPQAGAAANASASAASAAGPSRPAGETAARVDLRGPKPPMIVRLVQRDTATMSRLVDWLAGPDSDQRRRWQFCLSNFVDAVAATAIDNGYFFFAPGNPFWDQLTASEAREVTRALAALGFRYDGMGGFADGRVPGQHELSLAAGQAGLLTVRVRYWPRPAEGALLYRQVRVDAVELLAEKAPSITMGELVLMLGRRAEIAADLWNAWPRAQPLLLLPSRD